MIEYDHEPIRGLPGDLPEGERILWQGAPDAAAFARSALFTRWVAGYFCLLGMIALASGSLFGVVAIAVTGSFAIALLALFARLVAKTTVYTITNRRAVLRIGVALNKCINLPLKLVGGADLRRNNGAHGDIALMLVWRHALGYAMLWPHARPFRLGNPQPMLRAIPDAEAVALVLARACAAVVPNEIGAFHAPSVPTRGLTEVAA